MDWKRFFVRLAAWLVFYFVGINVLGIITYGVLEWEQTFAAWLVQFIVLVVVWFVWVGPWLFKKLNW